MNSYFTAYTFKSSNGWEVCYSDDTGEVHVDTYEDEQEAKDKVKELNHE